MIEIKNKADCCGCYACADICPKQSIIMKPDTEGFLYPLVNNNTCVDCHLCEKVCPIINVKKEIVSRQDGYLVQAKSDSIRSESTAGGAFTIIAQYVLKKHGVVFGVALDKHFHAIHKYVETNSELKQFRNSKYMQSVIGNTFNEAESFLKDGRLVLFSGTPCQIEGLKNFLGKEYVNLITLDVVCRAVPSPMIFDKYLEYQRSKLAGEIISIRFRDKFYGYKYSTMNILTDKNNSKYHRGIESDPWLRAFFANICDRPSCHSCKFRKRYRESDFTIWDCFSVGRIAKEMNDDKGTTRMLIHSEKGRNLFKNVKESYKIKQIDANILTEKTNEMFKSVVPNEKREEFFSYANNLSGIDLFEKYFPESLATMLKRNFRFLCNRLGIYSIVKNMYWKIIKKD